MAAFDPSRRAPRLGEGIAGMQKSKSRINGVQCLNALISAFVYLCQATIVSAEAVFVFQGTGEWSSFRHGELKDQHKLAFTAYCGDAVDVGWLIEFDYGAPYVSKFASGTDGSNIVTTAYYKPEYTNTPGYSIIERATIPRGDGFLPLSAIWIAYCSPNFLNALKTNRISPPYFKDGDMRAPGHCTDVEFNVERLGDVGGYVERMIFLHDGRAVSARGESIGIPSPFNHGFTNAIFSTLRLSQANRGAMQKLYPEESLLEYFYIYPDPKTGKNWRLFLSQSCRLVLTNAFQTNIGGRLLPSPLKGVGYNMDYRFVEPDIPSMVIAYKSDRVLRNHEVEQLPEFSRALLKQGKATQRTESIVARTRIARVTVLYLLVGSLAGAVGWIWLQHRHKHRNAGE